MVVRKRQGDVRQMGGFNIGRLRQVEPDEWTLYLRANTAAYVTSTTFLPHDPFATVDSPLSRGLREPSDECKHGRLPGDRTPPCGCWEEEEPRLSVKAGRGKGGRGEAKPLPRSQRKAA